MLVQIYFQKHLLLLGLFLIRNGKWNYPTHVVLDDRTKTSGQLFVE
ncbi:hypothetical protein CMALT394_60010 [Carnobacterium maltaromaticum]|nr:hypothetical protein CMALT394_60010 [Carnobacterium maltaromaticum]